MKKLILIPVWVFMVLISLGQTNDSLFFDNLSLPNAPAVSLLDQNPTLIETPESGKALAISVINAIQTNKGIPQNYALDFTPFWYVRHPKMTALKFARIDSKGKQNYFFDPAKISLSVATLITTDTITKFMNSNIAFGVKFNIITIKRKSDVQNYSKFYNLVIYYDSTKMDYCNLYIDSICKDCPNRKDLIKECYTNYPKIDVFIDSFKVISNIVRNQKPIFTMDGAIAYNGFFVNNNFKDYHFGRFGAWITMRYSADINKDKVKNNYVNIYAIGRYILDGTILKNGNYVRENMFDVGGKGEFEIQKFALGIEYMYRIQPTESSYRVCGNFKYRLSDKLALNCTFGRNFGNYNNVIAIMGVNWGFNTGLETMKLQ